MLSEWPHKYSIWYNIHITALCTHVWLEVHGSMWTNTQPCRFPACMPEKLSHNSREVERLCGTSPPAGMAICLWMFVFKKHCVHKNQLRCMLSDEKPSWHGFQNQDVGNIAGRMVKSSHVWREIMNIQLSEGMWEATPHWCTFHACCECTEVSQFQVCVNVDLYWFNHFTLI